MGVLVGIDLGTTNTCVAALRDGRPEIVRDAHGDRTLPSIVARTDSGEWLVGAAAKRQAVTNPANTIFGIKRLIGQRYDAPPLVDWARAVPYAVAQGDNGDAWVRIARQAMSPPEVCAHILRHVKAMAETRLETPVDAAVITVPAYFDDAQRQATRDAGTIAGLNVQAIINEPTAAALAYGAARFLDGARVAVFDLGGGTFDVSLLAIEAGVYEVLATHGDTFLGGDDFDRVLIDALIHQCSQEHGIDVRTSAMALQRLKEAAETAKTDLSALAAAEVALPFLADGPGGPVNLEHRFERTWYETACAPLLARLNGPCNAALADAGLVAADIDCVILVGGMTRMPAVEACAADLFGRAPVKDANPDEIVALGAATHAGSASGRIPAAVLLDVTSHSLGVKVGAGRMSVIVPRNTSLPASESREYKTLADDQDFVRVEVYQGDSELAEDNRCLGSVTLRDLPPGPAGSARVEVGFDIDTDGIVRITAREPASGTVATAELEHESGLSRDRVDELSGKRTGTAAAFEASRRMSAAVSVPTAPSSTMPAAVTRMAPHATLEPPQPLLQTVDDSETAPLVPDFFDSPPTLKDVAVPPPAKPSGRMSAVSGRSETASTTARDRRRRRSTAGYGFVSEQSRRITNAFRKRRSSGKIQTQSRPTIDRVQQDYEYAAKSDLFQQLGVHWTDAPVHIEAGYQALLGQYGPGSPASKTSPNWAAKRLALAEAAHAQLGSVAGRRAYRADKMHVDVKSAADLLVQQARLDLRRGDLDDAIDKLSAAMDLDPTQARRQQLDALIQRKRE